MRFEVFGCAETKDKIGVLIAQLGTPDAPTPSALRRYLREFLWDPRVIEVNRILWWVILHFVILVTRPARSARLYSRIWRKDGSPLLKITEAQTAKVRDELRKSDPSIEVEFGMRYGSHSLEEGIDTLIAKGCSRILLFPMYPQYAAATTASTYDAVFPHLLKRRSVPTLRVAEPYYAHPAYLQAVAATVNDYYASLGSDVPQKLVLSYHGIPERYVTQGDPYCCQCTETTAGLIPLLKIPQGSLIHTYQSRFGKDPWLVPYSDVTIETLAKEGITHIAVAAPGFTADCLETLDELGNEGTHLFQEHGGKKLSLIPCLNDSPAWIKGMAEIIREEIGSWRATSARSGARPCTVTCPVKEAKARGIRP